MNELLPVLFAGFGISILGQLPLGNLNVAATQIGVEENSFRKRINQLRRQCDYFLFNISPVWPTRLVRD